MKRMSMLIIAFILVFTLSSCVVDEPSGDPTKEEDKQIGDENEEENRMSAPSFIVELIEETIIENYNYYQFDNAVSNTKITKVYVGVNENNEDQLFIYRVDVMGRWDTISYILIIDSETQLIKGLEIISHGENWGSFIELDSFLNQFIDEDIDYFLSNDIELGIDGNASATTTIMAMNTTLEEIINHYKNNIQ